MADNYRILNGSKIRPDTLGLPRALSIYRAAVRHPYAQVISCKRNNSESEIILISLSKLGTPELPVYPIKDTEEVAIVCEKSDINAPRVYAFRRDFPIGLPHSNATEFEHPVWLCTSDVAFSQYRLQFSAYDFLNDIRNWLYKNSMGLLHEVGRTPEAFFSFNKLSYLTTYPTEGHMYGRLVNISTQSSQLSFVDRSEANYAIIGIPTKQEVATNFASKPKTMSDLVKYKDENGYSFPDSILRIVKAYPMELENLPILVILGIKQVIDRNSIEGHQSHFLIEIKVKACDIYSKFKRLTKESFYKWFNEIPIGIHFLIAPSSIQINAISNDTQMKLEKITLLGVGTLGANILDYLVREGVSREVALVDFDLLLPHNLARHILTAESVMQYKVNALEKHYSGIFDQKVTAIVGDFLSLPKQQEMHAFKGSELIIDATTSVAVERKLALDAEYGTKCRCTVFLNPLGTDLVLLMEDNERNQRLDLLEMSYLRNLITDPRMNSHLDSSKEQNINSFSCRSISAILDYDNIGILSAIASQQIKRKYVSNESCLSVWRVNIENSIVSKIELKQQQWTIKEVNQTKVYIASDVSDEIVKQRSEHIDKEIGGCLFGCYDKDRNIIYILYMYPSPDDSRCTPTSYIRGCNGLKEIGEDICKKTAMQVRYLGEWHSHLNDSYMPSSTDKKQFDKMSYEMQQEDLPFVQLICANKGFYVNASI